MKRLLFFSTLVSVFFISWFLSRALSPKYCINSSVVDRLATYSVTEAGYTINNQIQKCSLETLLAPSKFGDKYKEMRDFSERLEKVEPLVGASLMPSRNIFISYDDPFVYQMNGANIIIGYEQAKPVGGLEKALIESFLQLDSAAVDDLFIKEILSDILWAAINKNMDRESPLTRENIDFKNLTLSQALKNSFEYCNSSIVSSKHITYCMEQNTNIYRTQEEFYEMLMPTFWNLRPLISSIVWEYIKGEDIEFQTEVIHLLSNQDFSRFNGSKELLITKINSYRSTSIWLNLFIPIFLSELSDHRPINYENLSKVLIDKKVNHLQKFKYKITLLDQNYLSFDSTSGEDIDSESYIVNFGNGALYSGQNNFISRLFAFDFTYDQEILVGCKWPSPQELTKGSEQSKTIVFIKDCQNSISFNELAKIGIEVYLYKHAQYQFMEFHLPSIKLAERLSVRDIKSYDFQSLSSWKRFLGWKDTLWDQSKRFFKPQAVVDGVKAFRF